MAIDRRRYRERDRRRETNGETQQGKRRGRCRRSETEGEIENW